MAVKLATLLLPFSVVPVADLVVSRPLVLIAPAARSLIEPALPEESVTNPALIGARMLTEPVLVVLPALRIRPPLFPVMAAFTAILSSALRVRELLLDQLIGDKTLMSPLAVPDPEVLTMTLVKPGLSSAPCSA